MNSLIIKIGRIMAIGGMLCSIPPRNLAGTDTTLLIHLELRRISSRHGVIHGELIAPDGSIYPTIEAEKYIVVVGTYNTTLEWSKHFQRQIPLLQVPGRSGIEIHSASSVSQLRGCIGVSSDDFSSLITQLPKHQVFLVVISSSSI